ncbi:uncharacterized protein LOC112408693 [Neophocaena asiaeorientalis asiaeorientalis]|uniref:Uncharacterized protein LOC112408693 n=1 Tax=Neophocaena asiaeorientalis asiaeorientalis TaxID=1706337 RepID=A0A341CI32_NEOAA|nr:uncharacterized protein LOC112408693 [Neophocaena asiaeorientalis asiaeorientalis]
MAKSLGYVFRVLQGGRGHLLQEQRAGPSAGPVVRWLLPEGALVPPNPSPCSQGAADPSCSPAPVGSWWGYTALDESRFKGPQTPSVHMATLERRQGLASGGVCAEGVGLTDGWGLPQASQLATAQATPGGNGSQMLLSGLGVSLPITSGRQVVDGEARCLLAAGPNCSGDTKCELIAGPARASGPHTPGWGSFTVTQRSLLGFSYFSAAAFLGWRETLPGPPPAAAQPWSSQLPESGSPFLTSPGTSRLPSSSWQVLVHWSPEFVQPEKSHRCPGEDGPSGTIVHPGSPPPGSPPPGVCLCALPLCQLTPCVYPATSPLRHRALHLRSLLRLLTSSRPLSDKTLLFNPDEGLGTSSLRSPVTSICIQQALSAAPLSCLRGCTCPGIFRGDAESRHPGGFQSDAHTPHTTHTRTYAADLTANSHAERCPMRTLRPSKVVILPKVTQRRGSEQFGERPSGPARGAFTAALRYSRSKPPRRPTRWCLGSEDAGAPAGARGHPVPQQATPPEGSLQPPRAPGSGSSTPTAAFDPRIVGKRDL